MKIPREIEDQFFAGRPTKVTRFGINASVVIESGPFQGKVGSVVALLSVEPSAIYRIELADGTEVDLEEATITQI